MKRTAKMLMLVVVGGLVGYSSYADWTDCDDRHTVNAIGEGTASLSESGGYSEAYAKALERATESAARNLARNANTHSYDECHCGGLWVVVAGGDVDESTVTYTVVKSSFGGVYDVTTMYWWVRVRATGEYCCKCSAEEW
jgi:hypothetical protein